MNKKVVVLGGGTGLSCLLKGLKEFQVDIIAIVGYPLADLILSKV